MITEQQLQVAHRSIKNEADFLNYFKEIKRLGLKKYEFIVKDGVIIYHDEHGYRTRSATLYDPLDIVNRSSIAQLRLAIILHQAGQFDFPAFCRKAADAGVENWVVDIQREVCIYYDTTGNKMLDEPIPQLSYADISRYGSSA